MLVLFYWVISQEMTDTVILLAFEFVIAYSGELRYSVPIETLFGESTISLFGQKYTTHGSCDWTNNRNPLTYG